MVVSGALAVLSMAFALASGFSLAWAATETFSRVRLSSQALDAGGAVAWFARNGVAPFVPLGRVLLRFPAFREFVEDVVRMAVVRGVTTTLESASSLCLACLAALSVAALLVSGSLACAFASLCCLLLALAWFAQSKRERRAARVREAVPDVMRSMGVCFGSGMTLLQTMRHVALELDGPMREPFEDAVRTLETGGSAQEALACLRSSPHGSCLSFVAVALDVQHRSGGAVLPILESAREAAQDEIDLRRSLRVQTAQAKLSAAIVTAMPFVLVAVFSLVSEGFLAPFFESAAGVALLSIALVMQAAGVLLVRRMLNVDMG